MPFREDAALDVALPSAVVLAGELAPHATADARDRLVRHLTAHILTALHVYHEFLPPPPAPEPSAN